MRKCRSRCSILNGLYQVGCVLCSWQKESTIRVFNQVSGRQCNFNQVKYFQSSFELCDVEVALVLMRSERFFQKYFLLAKPSQHIYFFHTLFHSGDNEQSFAKVSLQKAAAAPRIQLTIRKKCLVMIFVTCKVPSMVPEPSVERHTSELCSAICELLLVR